jgi:hypothetical protein
VSAPAPLLPRSRRETFALICLGQLLWLLAILTLAGVSPWSTGTLTALAAGGAIGILAAGVLYARRLRR